ncbi:hypothetical protein V8E36_006767 [Tilletia maclaganii]
MEGEIHWKSTILTLEHVLAEKQKSAEGVRPYAERLRTQFIKAAALLRGVQPYLEIAKAPIRGFQSQGTSYTFDTALTFLISAEAAATNDQHTGKLSLLSRPSANVASSSSKDQSRRFQIVRRLPSKGMPGYFNGECRNCGKWGHKIADCEDRKKAIDTGAHTPEQPKANVAEAEDDGREESDEFHDAATDTDGEIFELKGDDNQIYYARLTTGPQESNAAASLATGRVAFAMIASAARASITTEPEIVSSAELEALAAQHILEKAVKCIIASGATHHFGHMSELLPIRVGTSADAVVHVADGTKAKITRRGACVATLFGDGGSEAEVHLKSVLVVPSFTRNLLSVQRLTDDGWTVKFTKSGAELRNPKGDPVQTFTEPSTGHPYVMMKPKPVRYIDVKGVSRTSGPARAVARAATSSEKKIQAHKILGHASISTIRTLVKDKAFARKDRPSPKDVAAAIMADTACDLTVLHDPCIEAKQPLLPVGTSSTEAPAKMSDIHFDLCGPFEGNHEYKYSMQILDAWSRRLWIYALSNKEAATVFEVSLALC